MAKTHILWYFLVSLFLWGCNQQKGFKFKTETSLQGVEFITNDTLAMGKTIVFDSLLIVVQSDNREKCLRILDLNTQNLISAAAMIGRGPGEIANPANISIDEKGRIL